jgi:hypothetical protein
MAKRGPFGDIRRGLLAAAQLGFGDAFEAALESFTALPTLRGNIALDKSMVEGLLLPLGDDLGRIMYTHGTDEPLRSLAVHSFAAVRCLAASALPHMWEHAGVISITESLSKDARPEVRNCLAHALRSLPNTDRWDLVASWLHADSPRQQSLALRILPPNPLEDALAAIAARRADTDHEVAETAVDALCRLAERKPAFVLKALATWAASADVQTTWIIAHTLAHPPLVAHSAVAVEILDALTASVQDAQSRHTIEVALRAVARKSGAADVRAKLQAWTEAPEPDRKIIADHVLRRLDETDE